MPFPDDVDALTNLAPADEMDDAGKEGDTIINKIHAAVRSIRDARGVANGFASLGADAKIPPAQLSAIAITDTHVVASEAAMLALVAETGDVAIRTDLSKSFILDGDDPSVLANWQELVFSGGGAHDHDATYQAISEKGAASGYAPLGADSKVPAANLPAASSFVGCRVKRTTAQSIPNATATVVNFTAEDYDTNALHDNTTNNHRITVPTGLVGKWRFTAFVSFASNATGRRWVSIRRNGADASGVSFQSMSAVSGATTDIQVVLEIEMAATDYVDLRAYQDSGGALNIDGSPYGWMSAQYLGA